MVFALLLLGCPSKTTAPLDLAVGVCACNAPPAGVCLDANTLRAYEDIGTCGNNSCTYAHWDVMCSNGCSGRACVGNDPCDGKSCLSPPATSCSGSVLTSYSSSGTCSNGTCAYAYTSTACTGGCAKNACIGDVCAGVTCDSPPASMCSGTNLLGFSGGTCQGGSCSYAATNAPCPAPQHGISTCENGTCGFTCVSGYYASGSSCVMNEVSPPDLSKSCIATCTADTDCQNSCPAPSSGVSCCDQQSLKCYTSQTSVCPAASDASMISPY